MTEDSGNITVVGKTGLKKRNTVLAVFFSTEMISGAVISVVPESTAFAAVYKIQNLVLYITLIALGFAVIFIYLFSKTLTKPLGALVRAAGDIQNGDFTVTVPSTSRDEIKLGGERKKVAASTQDLHYI